tara:strand:+ start:117 stop:776 length:660 start_codon:yes stop_codon:yes gene_type:complete
LAIDRSDKYTDNVGGNSELYIFKYVDYMRSQIKVTNNILVTFPTTVVYNLNSSGITFNENVDEEDGGVVFSQSGSYELKKILALDSYKEFVANDWRVIIKDNNGNYRLIGLETGLKIKYTKENGANLSDFNGFKFSFETKEENTAPFLYNLNSFNIINTSPENHLYMTYNTYADMISAGSTDCVLNIRILNDENKGLENTTYLFYPDGVRLWVASTSDN